MSATQLPRSSKRNKEGRRLTWDDPRLASHLMKTRGVEYLWGYRTPGVEELYTDHPVIVKLVQDTKGQLHEAPAIWISKAIDKIGAGNDFDLEDSYWRIAQSLGYTKKSGVGKGLNRTTAIFRSGGVQGKILQKQWRWGQYFQYCPSQREAEDFCLSIQVTMMQLMDFLAHQKPETEYFDMVRLRQQQKQKTSNGGQRKDRQT